MSSVLRTAANKWHRVRRNLLPPGAQLRLDNDILNAFSFLPEVPAARTHSDDDILPLRDISMGVKDNICVSSMPTTCSSPMLLDFESPFDATVVDLLYRAGAKIVGKTNCDEFGMGISIPFTVLYEILTVGHVRTGQTTGGSHDVRVEVPGGAQRLLRTACVRRMDTRPFLSSDIADDVVKESALATDTGGSTRLPASYCGIVGLKPSYGVISRWGVVSYADSLDCVGIMAKDVALVQNVFDVLAVYDPKDPTAAKPHIRARAAQVCETQTRRFPAGSTSAIGLRVGIPQEYFPAELHSGIMDPVRRVLTSLQTLGATLVPVSLPTTPYALSAYYVIASAEASSNLARFDGIQYGLHVDLPPGSDATKTANVYAHTRSRGFGREAQKRILLGTYALTADAFDNYFLQAQRVRKLVRADFDRVFRGRNVLSDNTTAAADDVGVDVLLHPSAMCTAPLLPDGLDVPATLDAYVQDALSVPASLAGLPAMSVPAGNARDAWPVGVSVVGQWGCDAMVMRVGELIERTVRDAGDA